MCDSADGEGNIQINGDGVSGKMEQMRVGTKEREKREEKEKERGGETFERGDGGVSGRGTRARSSLATQRPKSLASLENSLCRDSPNRAQWSPLG